MDILLQSLNRHVLEVVSSKLEVSKSISRISSDDVDGRLSHTRLAHTSPLRLSFLGIIGNKPTVIDGTLIRSVSITNSGDVSGHHGRDKGNFGNQIGRAHV